MSLEEEIQVFLNWMIRRRITHPMIILIKDYSQKLSNNVYEKRIYVVSIEDTSTSYFCHVPQRFQVSNITELSKDTTGAGDALAAGFLYGILEGEDIKTCTDFGFIMSREASEEFGARSNLPDQYLLRDYLSQ